MEKGAEIEVAIGPEKWRRTGKKEEKKIREKRREKEKDVQIMFG